MSKVFVAAVVTLFTTYMVQASEVDTLRKNVINYLTAAGADRSDQRVAAAINKLNTDTKAVQSDMNSDGSWPGIDYSEVPGTGWTPGDHYTNLKIMATAYNTAGQDLYLDNDLLADIETGMANIQSHYSVAGDILGNWWWGDIGIPLRYGPTLVLMQGKIDPVLFSAAAATQRSFVASSSGAGDANANWVSICQFYSAIVDSNSNLLNKIKGDFAGRIELQSSLADGLQTDYSWHSHGPQIYTGGYGAAFVQAIVNYCYFSRNTSYQLATEKFDLVSALIGESMLWCLNNNYWDIAVMGRSYTRSNASGSAGLEILLNAVQFDNPYKDQCIAGAKKMMENWGEYSLEAAGIANLAANSPVEAAWPIGHKHYNCSDYTVHRREDQFISVRMFSDRILSGEGTNNEPEKTWNQSDGFTFIQRGAGGEYQVGNTLPTLDWERLPGTTTEKKSRTSSYKGWLGIGFRSFVGGTTDGKNGTSAMDFLDQIAFGGQGNLNAKKSWFFFDNEMICLGSDINCATSNTVETIVNQRPIPAADIPLIVDGTAKPADLGWSETMSDISWAHFDSIGYYFPGGQTVKGIRKEQTGSWLGMNGEWDTNTDEVFSRNFITLYYDHGTQVSGASYAYGVVMNCSSSDMENYAVNSPVTIIAQTDSIHAVKHNTMNAVGAVFWEAGTVDKITVDQPCIVYYSRTGNEYSIALSEPSYRAVIVTLIFNEKLTPLTLADGVTSETAGTTTEIIYTVTSGRNYISTFTTSSVIADAEGRQESAMSLEAYPNPFNPSTTISINQKGGIEKAKGTIRIYNFNGVLVGQLPITSTAKNGVKSITWNAKNYSSGVYMVKAVIGNKILTKNIVLVL